MLRRVEGPWEERRQRQLAVLSVVHQVLERDFGTVPLWWAELRAEVREGRL